MNLYILFQDEFAERIAGHLINDVNFCTSCGNGCNNCRLSYGSHAGSIIGYEEIEPIFEDFIDEPFEYLPASMPSNIDILIPVGLHPDLLSAIPEFCKIHGILAVIVPVEDKNWCPFGLQTQMMKEFKKEGIQFSFPRPFCKLEVENGDETKNIIKEFIDEFKIGKPIIHLHVDKDTGKIKDGYVSRSQPCGCAYYLIQQLREENVYDLSMSLDEKISLAHHSFPCSASMDKDIILNDSPLHIGGYLARDAIHDAIERALGFVDKEKLHKRSFEETLA